jgi:hypothetical protein
MALWLQGKMARSLKDMLWANFERVLKYNEMK